MSVANALRFEGKKFFWDGEMYPSPEDAARAQVTYERDGFETITAKGEGAFLVYTRRVVGPAGDVKAN